MSDELKPCPFCGGQAVVERQPLIFSAYGCIVYCPRCYGGDGNVLKRGYDLADAVKKWNQRA